MDNKALLWPKNTNLNCVVVIGVREGGLCKFLRNFIKSMIHNILNPCELWNMRLGHAHFKELPSL